MKPLANSLKSALLVALAALALSGCSLLPEEKIEAIPTLIEPPPSRAVTYPVERKRIVEELRGLSRVAPTLETDMYFKETGRLATLNVQPGQRVTEGELLAQLETGSLEHQLAQAEIDMEIARLRLAATQGAAPIDVQLQELSTKKAELNVENLRARLEAATIRAPHDGVVQSVRGQVGQIINEYTTLMVVADPTAIEIRLEIRRREDIEKLARGQKALVEVSRDNWAPATVVQITEESQSPSSLTATYIVHVELDDPDSLQGLRLGDLLTTRIIVREKEDALVIPRAALREFMGRRYVRVLDGDARREVDVDIGIVTPTEVEILAGISEGDLVIGQ